jgi:hypothetical protein
MTMRKIKLTSDMVQRIEDALDERKVQRRARAQAGATGERRCRPDRRAAATDDKDAQAAAPAEPLKGGKSAPG